MKTISFALFSSLMFLAACGDAEKGAAGAECSSDGDCAEGLHCHMHEGEDDHGECEEEEGHSDDEEATDTAE